MNVREITVGKEIIRLKTSALLPKLYRARFNRDIMVDMQKIQKSFKRVLDATANGTEEEKVDAELSVLDLTIFEDISYIMAKHADKSIPDDPDEWLESIPGTWAVYKILPVIFEMWREGEETTAIPAKK